jgi:hypothetical protein
MDCSEASSGALPFRAALLRDVRKRIDRDKFPKHIYHSIVCIGALVARLAGNYWSVRWMSAAGSRPGSTGGMNAASDLPE